MKKKNIFLGLALAWGLTGCYDLDMTPEGVVSSTTPFTSTGEIKNYINQFYETGLRAQNIVSGGGGGIAGDDVNSDNIASNTVNIRLAGESTLNSASAMNEYTHIRGVNFFLNNLDNCADKGSAEYNQYVGEAYYFRAWYYYQLFIKYGEVTWIDKPLNPSIGEMKLPRDSRTKVADYILADLDKAIEYLQTQNNSASMRIHKDVARTLKSEVALFAGTWEKYHKAENTPFYDKTVTDAKINSYLTQAAEAAKAVMDRGVWKIHNTGNVNNDYRIIFQTTDLSTNSEVMWFRKYDGDNVGNHTNRYLNMGGGEIGVTASLVNDYLTIDGRPFVGSERTEAQKVYGDELLPTVRDPRLAQTVATPGQILRPDEGGYTLPPLTGSGYHRNMSGYSLLKHVQIDYTGNLDAENKGATPAIQFRYADVLLNYAEALAELDGAGNAQKIIEALQPLRDRVGMPAVDFDREYNTEADYPFRGLDKYIQAVRRERRIEKACEGRRLDDILRWAAADELILGQWPMGALFVGSNLEGNPAFGDALVYDQGANSNFFLTGSEGDAMRYIIPTNPNGYPNGWQFKLDRDYLLPIQQRMLSEDLTGGLWEQNPGW